MRGLAFVAASALVAAACGTIGSDGKGDSNLPTAGVGPFRRLEAKEVPGVPPIVLDHVRGQLREPAAIATADGIVLFAGLVRKDGTTAIVRSRSIDGRAFFGVTTDSGNEAPVVLAPSPDEGTVGGPAVLAVGSEMWMYYASNRGVRLARSSDGGHTFARQAEPALAASVSLSAPSVARMPDGSFRMFYGSGGTIEEASSADGLRFTRVGLALAPFGDVDPATLAPGEKPPFDALSVGDPDVSVRITEGDRLHLRVLYTGTRVTAGKVVHSLGFAARYGESGPLERQALPVLSSGKGERAPALVALEGHSLVLFEAASSNTNTDTIIAAGVSPATIRLPEPSPFPSTP